MSVRYSPGGTTCVVLCDECGEIVSEKAEILKTEHEKFGAAYLHAKEYAHKVRVISTVSTILNGYVEGT